MSQTPLRERPRLDRLVEFDNRSRDYPIARLLTSDTPRSYTWRCDTWLDQGREGACVGFAWAHEAAAVPVKHPVLTQTAQAIYYEARRLDQWPGENYDGTSVIAGAKATQARGYLKEYRWAFGLNELLVAVSRHGPAVLGVNWYDDMWDTDTAGFLHVGGRIAGGHAILMTGVNVRLRTVTLHNSWGRDWGVNGKAMLSWDDLARLLAEDGEACIPVRR